MSDLYMPDGLSIEIDSNEIGQDCTVLCVVQVYVHCTQILIVLVNLMS